MSRPHDGEALVRAMPALFVLLWSTGFIGAKYGLPHAEPLTFLSIRFLLVIALLSAVALLTRAPWPANRRLTLHLAVSGFLVHAVYLGGVFSAIHLGLPSGLTALIVGLQPLLTAGLAGAILGERVSSRQWLGLALGLGGVALVLSARLGSAATATFGLGAVIAALAALLGITLGTLYQKRHCTGMDLRTGAVIQYVGALVATGAGSFAFETQDVRWTMDFVLAMAWLVLVLSVGAITLLMMLIRRGEAARVAGFFYLVPPVTALMAWGLFEERIGSLGLAGMAVTAVGVALAVVPAGKR